MQVGHSQIILLDGGSLEIHLNLTVCVCVWGGDIILISVNSPQVTPKNFSSI